MAALFAPRSIAIVGASERSRWSAALVANLEGHGFDGNVQLVNRRGADVHGRATVPSCSDLQQPVDLGIVIVPADAVVDAVRDLGSAGARATVVLSSGFAETGPDGERLQEELLQTARAADMRLLGPNSLGFMSFASNVVAWATPIHAPTRRDGVAIVSQSGATAFFLANLAHQQDVGLSHVVGTGNEADLDEATIVHHLAADDSVRAIAMFVETVRDPESFVAAADAAREAGKPVVVLKVGASEATARSALAHTGALVGDDRVFDGICARHGILRAHSLEDLLTTADVIARTGPLRRGGLCVISNSGGVCEIAADRAEALGMAMPDVPDRLGSVLRDAMPGFGTPHNPLDLTGGITPEGTGDIVAALAADEAYSALIVPFYAVPDSGEPDERLAALYENLARALKKSPIPAFLVSYTAGGITHAGRRLIAELELPYMACGMDRALTGLAAAFRWSQAAARTHPGAPITDADAIADRPRSEQETVALMARHGVPVVSQVLATEPADAVQAARGAEGPVALKVASADIGHKSEIGGVELGVEGDDEVATAFTRVLEAGRAQTGATVDGVLVSPMRTGGVELFAGCSQDPVWGPVIAVGLGGIWVEVFSDVAIRPLPVSAEEVAGMLRELRGARLLAGERGTEAVDLHAVGAAVAAIGDLALRLGPDLAALDVNPLWVRGSHVEALDGLAIWEDGQ